MPGPTETQSEWFTSANPDNLLWAIWPHPPLWFGPDTANWPLPASLARKLRLSGVAWGRMVWHLLSTDSRNAVLLSERYADGRATSADLQAATVRRMYGPVTYHQQATNAASWASADYWEPLLGTPVSEYWNPVEASREAAKALATRAAGPVPAGGSPVAKEWEGTWNAAYHAARAHQAELVRDIFPPPGYSPAIHPDWRTSTVMAIARQADETGDFSAVPILADALQDAGCDDEVMLGRCRAPSGVHCRGNWVVDLLLGRE